MTPKLKTFEQFHDKIIGLSVSNLDELKRSDLTHVDYIGLAYIPDTIKV